MASIYNPQNGQEITVGLPGCTVSDEAIQMAQRIADKRGHDVQLADDDGSWMVHPMIAGKREAADPVEE